MVQGGLLRRRPDHLLSQRSASRPLDECRGCCRRPEEMGLQTERRGRDGSTRAAHNIRGVGPAPTLVVAPQDNISDYSDHYTRHAWEATSPSEGVEGAGRSHRRPFGPPHHLRYSRSDETNPLDGSICDEWNSLACWSGHPGLPSLARPLGLALLEWSRSESVTAGSF